MDAVQITGTTTLILGGAIALFVAWDRAANRKKIPILAGCLWGSLVGVFVSLALEGEFKPAYLLGTYLGGLLVTAPGGVIGRLIGGRKASQSATE